MVDRCPVTREAHVPVALDESVSPSPSLTVCALCEQILEFTAMQRQEGDDALRTS